VNNFIEDVLLDGGFGVNIIMKKLRMQLGLSKPKPTPYNLCMANQTIAKPLGLIKELKIFIHGIPYAITFTMILCSVLNSSYFMFLSCPWLKDTKVSHDWGNDTIIIQGTNIIRTTFVTKKFGAPTKHPKVLICYGFHSRIFDKEEDLMFIIEPGLFSIGTIIVLIPVWLDIVVKLITSAGLNLVE
jgi:hypothetical protein